MERMIFLNLRVIQGAPCNPDVHCLIIFYIGFRVKCLIVKTSIQDQTFLVLDRGHMKKVSL